MKKGIISLLSILLIVVAVGLVLAAVPGLGQSILAVITNNPQHCFTTPYAANCICGYDEEKQRQTSVSYGCVPAVQPPASGCKYPIAVPSSINDEVYRSMAFACAQEFLDANYPNCDTKSCEAPMFRDIGKMYDPSTGSNYIQVECGDPTISRYYWRVVLDMSDGLVFGPVNSYCLSIGD